MFRFFQNHRTRVEVNITYNILTVNINEQPAQPTPRIGQVLEAKLVEAAQREQLLVPNAKLLTVAR